MLPGSQLPRSPLRGHRRTTGGPNCWRRAVGCLKPSHGRQVPTLTFGCCQVKNAQWGFAVSDVCFVAKLAARAAALAFAALTHARVQPPERWKSRVWTPHCAGDCRSLRTPLSFGIEVPQREEPRASEPHASRMRAFAGWAPLAWRTRWRRSSCRTDGVRRRRKRKTERD